MSNYTSNDLEICIATADRDNLSFLESIFNCSLASIPYKVLVVNQSKASQLTSDYPAIKVINDTMYGLSNSRNIALAYATNPLLWLLDDDCMVLPAAVNTIVKAHITSDAAIITWQTQVNDKQLFRAYPLKGCYLNKRTIGKVLSPEITIKNEVIAALGLRYDTRFGLGAQFADSENYIFLQDALKAGLQIYFKPQTIVQHPSQTSSDNALSDHVIYTRGAIAGCNYGSFAWLWALKYVFFAARKRLSISPKKLMGIYKTFIKGAQDYTNSQD